MSITKHIPNTITCLNLCSGCISCVMACGGNLYMAALFVILAAVFDFLDGFAARWLHAYSSIGKDLDSLADVVSFGVAPGMMLFSVWMDAFEGGAIDSVFLFVPYLAFIIPAFSALRLAKFNNDPRQTTSFIGLPVPANALFWISAVYSTQQLAAGNVILYTVVALIGIGITSFLLVSEIPMFSLKIKSLAWKGNEFRYILGICAVLFVALWGFLGIAGTMLLYIALSVVSRGK